MAQPWPSVEVLCSSLDLPEGSWLTSGCLLLETKACGTYSCKGRWDTPCVSSCPWSPPHPLLKEKARRELSQDSGSLTFGCHCGKNVGGAPIMPPILLG